MLARLAAVLAIAFLTLTPAVGLANEHDETTTTTVPPTTTTTVRPETTTTTSELPTTTTTTVPTEEATSALLRLCRVIHDQDGDRTDVRLVDELDQPAVNELIESGYVLFEGPLPAECIPVPASDPTSEDEPAPNVTRTAKQPFVDLDCEDFKDRDFPVQAGDPHDLDRDNDGIACETSRRRNGKRTEDDLPSTGQPGWMIPAGAGLLSAGGLLLLARRRWFA